MHKHSRNKKRNKISCWCTATEKKFIEVRAKEAALSTSQYLRELGLQDYLKKPKTLPKEVLAFNGLLNQLAAYLSLIARKRLDDETLNALERAKLQQLAKDINELIQQIKTNLHDGQDSHSELLRQALHYCLEDKYLTLKQEQQVLDQTLSPEHQQPPKQRPQKIPLFTDRAEIIWYNQCFGNQQELIRQFNEVARLQVNMSLPVMHISISLPPGERLKKGALVELGADCARSLGFDKNQYLTILHKDTPQQHIHLVANRVGFDGHTVSDSFSHGKIADFCREAELRHGLLQEQGPRRYQTKEQRQTPRHGLRLDKLKQTISQVLLKSANYLQFEQIMKEKGYTVHKSQKGIAFMDGKKVFIKGCDVDHPWHKIEATLSQDLLLRRQQHLLKLENEREQWLDQHPELRIRRSRQHGLDNDYELSL